MKFLRRFTPFFFLFLLSISSVSETIQPDYLNLESVSSTLDNKQDFVRKVNNNSEKINLHDHSTGKGLRVKTQGLLIDGDLSLNGFGLILSRYLSLAGDFSGIAPNNSLFLKEGILTLKDASGNEQSLTGVSEEEIGRVVDQYLTDNPTSENALSIKTKYESNPDTNAFTNALKNKLDGLEVQIQSDWSETDTTAKSFILNKPTIPVIPDFPDPETGETIKGKLEGLSGESRLSATAIKDLPEAEAESGETIKGKLEGLSGESRLSATAIKDLPEAEAESATTIKTKYESNPDTNSFTDSEKTKLGTLEEQVQSNWNETDTTAKSFILNKPTISSGGSGEENVQSDWNITDTTSDAFILNKPTIPSGGGGGGGGGGFTASGETFPSSPVANQSFILTEDQTITTVTIPKTDDITAGAGNYFRAPSYEGARLVIGLADTFVREKVGVGAIAFSKLSTNTNANQPEKFTLNYIGFNRAGSGHIISDQTSNFTVSMTINTVNFEADFNSTATSGHHGTLASHPFRIAKNIESLFTLTATGNTITVAGYERADVSESITFQDGLYIRDGDNWVFQNDLSELQSLIMSGVSLPMNPIEGQLFYFNEQRSISGTQYYEGLYRYTSGSWNRAYTQSDWGFTSSNSDPRFIHNKPFILSTETTVLQGRSFDNFSVNNNSPTDGDLFYLQNEDILTGTAGSVSYSNVHPPGLYVYERNSSGGAISPWKPLINESSQSGATFPEDPSDNQIFYLTQDSSVPVYSSQDEFEFTSDGSYSSQLAPTADSFIQRLYVWSGSDDDVYINIKENLGTLNSISYDIGSGFVEISDFDTNGGGGTSTINGVTTYYYDWSTNDLDGYSGVIKFKFKLNDDTFYQQMAQTGSAPAPAGLYYYNSAGSWTLIPSGGGGGGSGEENVQSDWNVTDTTSDAFILNKPTIPTGGGGGSSAVNSGLEFPDTPVRHQSFNLLEDLKDGYSYDSEEFPLDFALNNPDPSKLVGHDYYPVRLVNPNPSALIRRIEIVEPAGASLSDPRLPQKLRIYLRGDVNVTPDDFHQVQADVTNGEEPNYFGVAATPVLKSDGTLLYYQAEGTSGAESFNDHIINRFKTATGLVFFRFVLTGGNTPTYYTETVFDGTSMESGFYHWTGEAWSLDLDYKLANRQINDLRHTTKDIETKEDAPKDVLEEADFAVADANDTDLTDNVFTSSEGAYGSLRVSKKLVLRTPYRSDHSNYGIQIGETLYRGSRFKDLVRAGSLENVPTISATNLTNTQDITALAISESGSYGGHSKAGSGKLIFSKQPNALDGLPDFITLVYIGKGSNLSTTERILIQCDIEETTHPLRFLITINGVVRDINLDRLDDRVTLNGKQTYYGFIENSTQNPLPVLKAEDNEVSIHGYDRGLPEIRVLGDFTDTDTLLTIPSETVKVIKFGEVNEWEGDLGRRPLGQVNSIVDTKIAEIPAPDVPSNNLTEEDILKLSTYKLENQPHTSAVVAKWNENETNTRNVGLYSDDPFTAQTTGKANIAILEPAGSGAISFNIMEGENIIPKTLIGSVPSGIGDQVYFLYEFDAEAGKTYSAVHTDIIQVSKNRVDIDKNVIDIQALENRVDVLPEDTREVKDFHESLTEGTEVEDTDNIDSDIDIAKSAASLDLVDGVSDGTTTKTFTKDNIYGGKSLNKGSALTQNALTDAQIQNQFANIPITFTGASEASFLAGGKFSLANVTGKKDLVSPFGKALIQVQNNVVGYNVHTPARTSSENVVNHQHGILINGHQGNFVTDGAAHSYIFGAALSNSRNGVTKSVLRMHISLLANGNSEGFRNLDIPLGATAGGSNVAEVDASVQFDRHSIPVNYKVINGQLTVEVTLPLNSDGFPIEMVTVSLSILEDYVVTTAEPATNVFSPFLLVGDPTQTQRVTVEANKAFDVAIDALKRDDNVYLRGVINGQRVYNLSLNFFGGTNANTVKFGDTGTIQTRLTYLQRKGTPTEQRLTTTTLPHSIDTVGLGLVEFIKKVVSGFNISSNVYSENVRPSMEIIANLLPTAKASDNFDAKDVALTKTGESFTDPQLNGEPLFKIRRLQEVSVTKSTGADGKGAKITLFNKNLAGVHALSRDFFSNHSGDDNYKAGTEFQTKYGGTVDFIIPRTNTPKNLVVALIVRHYNNPASQEPDVVTSRATTLPIKSTNPDSTSGESTDAVVSIGLEWFNSNPVLNQDIPSGARIRIDLQVLELETESEIKATKRALRLGQEIPASVTPIVNKDIEFIFSSTQVSFEGSKAMEESK